MHSIVSFMAKVKDNSSVLDYWQHLTTFDNIVKRRWNISALLHNWNFLCHGATLHGLDINFIHKGLTQIRDIMERSRAPDNWFRLWTKVWRWKNCFVCANLAIRKWMNLYFILSSFHLSCNFRFQKDVTSTSNSEYLAFHLTPYET